MKIAKAAGGNRAVYYRELEAKSDGEAGEAEAGP